jgi:hypothetical protein
VLKFFKKFSLLKELFLLVNKGLFERMEFFSSIIQKSYILIHLVCQSVTWLGKGVLCSREFSAVGRTVAADSEDQARGIDELKNRSGKCEGPGRGDRRVKEPEWEM